MPRLLPERFCTECIAEFDLAATERISDAATLARAGRRTAAIYLSGYAVEMLLKAAYFRLIGYGDGDPVGIVQLRQAVGDSPASTARSLGLAGTRNLHDLGAWAALIVTYRTARLLPYPTADFGRILTAQVATVRDRWTETVRYHKNVAYHHELEAVTRSCAWVSANRYEL